MNTSNDSASGDIWGALLAVWAGVVVLVIALTILATAGPAAAAPPPVVAGIIVSAAGETSLVRTGQITSPAGRLQEVFEGDRLKTGSNGHINLRFSDGMRMSLGPTTQFHIDDYDDQQGEERSFFSLVRGSLRTITGLIGKSTPTAFRLNTPTAVIGVRGTDFTVMQADCVRTDCASGSSPAMEVAVSNGAIDVGNQSGSLLVMAGQRAQIGLAADDLHLAAPSSAKTCSGAGKLRARTSSA